MIFQSTVYDVTLDESPGLQNASATDTDDQDDNDIALTSITSMLASLAALGAPATAIGAAANRVVSFADTATSDLSFVLPGDVSSIASGLSTTSGHAITLQLASGGDVILGTYNSGASVAFALVLGNSASTGAGDNGGVQVTQVLYEGLSHPDSTNEDDALDLTGLVSVAARESAEFKDFSDAPAGQNLWTSVTDDTSGIQILVTGETLGADTVNTRNTSLGSNKQSIDPREGLVFDFVRDQTAPTSSTAKTLATVDFTQHYDGDTGGFTIAQVNGSHGARVDVKLVAYDSSETGADFNDGTIAAPATAIGAIRIYSGTQLVRSWDGTAASGSDTAITFAPSGDGWIIDGLKAHYRVEFDTSASFDRFSVVNAGAPRGSHSFDLADIRVSSSVHETADIGSHVRFEDDGPRDLTAVSASVADLPGDPATFLLDSGGLTAFQGHFGTDGYGNMVFHGTDGAALLDTTDHALTSMGTPITLSGFGTGVLTASAGATTVFTISLDAATGHYTVDMDAKIDNGSFAFDNFGAGGAGLRYWLGVAGSEDTTKDLLVTGGHPGIDTVNNDSDDIGTNNQWIDRHEAIRLDFVSGIDTTTGTSSIDNIPSATHYDVNNAGFMVMQSKGTTSGVDVQIAAIDAARDIASPDVAADLQAGTHDTITSVTVHDGTTGLETTYLRTGGNSSVVTWLANDVVVQHLDAPSSSQRDMVFVSTADGFSRMEITNVDGRSTDSFSIGGVDVRGNAGNPIDMQFHLDLTDGDGDAAVGLIGVTLTP